MGLHRRARVVYNTALSLLRRDQFVATDAAQSARAEPTGVDDHRDHEASARAADGPSQGSGKLKRTRFEGQENNVNMPSSPPHGPRPPRANVVSVSTRSSPHAASRTFKYEAPRHSQSIIGEAVTGIPHTPAMSAQAIRSDRAARRQRLRKSRDLAPHSRGRVRFSCPCSHQEASAPRVPYVLLRVKLSAPATDRGSTAAQSMDGGSFIGRDQRTIRNGSRSEMRVDYILCRLDRPACAAVSTGRRARVPIIESRRGASN